MNDKWSEIRCNYLDEKTGFWSVDSWTGSDDCEEGKVIAFIDDLTARVIYVDPVARVDSYAQRIINSKLHELESNRIRVRRESGNLNVYFETDAGALVAQVERKEDVGTDNMFIGIHFHNLYDDYIDLVGVKIMSEKGDIENFGNCKNYAIVPMMWGDPKSEDYTERDIITDGDVMEALKDFE